MRIFIIVFIIFASTCMNIYSEGFLNFEKSENEGQTHWFVSEIKPLEFLRNSKPLMEFMWGSAQPDFNKDNFETEFTDVFSGEIRLGKILKEIGEFEYAGLMNYKFSYLYLANLSNDYVTSADGENKIEMNTWTLGFGDNVGYGYYTKAADYILYSGNSFYWAKNEFSFNTAEPNTNDRADLDYIEDGIRFGESCQAGLKIGIFNTTAINFEYEQSYIYPRFVFFEWLGSNMVFQGGLYGAGYLSEYIMKQFPDIGPLANFIIRNAYSFLYFSLKNNDIFFPFNSGNGIKIDSYKVGLSFMF